MAACQHLLEILSDGRFHSGPSLGAALGISRSAIWKQIRLLKELGLEMHTVPGRGYRLADSLELLQLEAIRSSMSDLVLRRLAGLEVHFELDSTNDYLSRRAAQGLSSMTACLAECQTAGRGRQGRIWVSSFGGGLYLSLFWPSPLSPSELGGVSLVVGLAVLRALQQCDIQGVGLKWPNDMLWQGRKLGGVLLDVSGESGGPCNVVIGVGINLKIRSDAMMSVDQPWVDLHTITKGQNPSRNQLAGLVLEKIIEVLQQFQEHGLESFLTEWQQYDLVAGQQVKLELPDRTVIGTAEGIDASGALVMNTDGRQCRFASGEVSVRLGE